MQLAALQKKFPDEIEELLEDLNRLEMASFDADDFDIDGSQISSFAHSRPLQPALHHSLPTRLALLRYQPLWQEYCIAKTYMIKKCFNNDIVKL